MEDALLHVSANQALFHISPLDVDTDGSNWYKKLFPLADSVRNAFKEYIVPAQKVSGDEMMVAF